MKLIKIEMIMILEDEGRPDKWIPEALYECFNTGEDLLEFDYKVLKEDVEVDNADI
jgi:hypothetical protein